jgi:serine/tyrosine/threonine adenylyltransferase
MNARSPAPLSWANRFAGLGPAFYTELGAAGLPDPHWVAWSDDCAAALGLPPDWRAEPSPLGGAAALQVFSGNATWPGMRPL